MIKIELMNEKGEKETHIKEYVTGRATRSVVEFGAKAEKEELSELEQIDALIYLVVNMFKDEKVTFDTILDGTKSDELLDTLKGVIGQVMGGDAKDGGKPDK